MKSLYLVAPQKEGLLVGNPYSLLYLGGWVKKKLDVQVKIVQSEKEIIGEKDVYVGISVTTPTYQKGLDIAKALKNQNSNIKTILGGYHTKGQGEIILNNHPEIDFVVEGSGEKALVQILKGRNHKLIYGTPLSSSELDQLMLEDLFQLDKDYFKTMTQFERINYISSRGCFYSCSFCASNGDSIKKSTIKVADDLEKLVNLGFFKVSIQDNYFGYNSQRIKEICNEIIKRKIIIDWDCQTRVESMQDKNTLELMAKAGCSAVYIGTENFHEKVLLNMNKTINPKGYVNLAKQAIQNLLFIGIKPYLNLQVGMVYENEEIREQNIICLKEIGNLVQDNSIIKIYPHLNVIYPGTSDFNDLVNMGVPKDIFESFTEWEEQNGNQIQGLLKENHFIHGAGGIPLGILVFEDLKKRKFSIDEDKIQEINIYMQRLKGINAYFN